MKENILIIEDNEQNLYLLRFILQKKGFQVFAAMEGRLGIEMAEELKPDLILLDIQLPEMDGYKVARLLRETAGLADVPIIALEAGCVGYIEKPINPDTFVQQVEQYLRCD